jgi:hypothetical protein
MAHDSPAAQTEASRQITGPQTLPGPSGVWVCVHMVPAEQVPGLHCTRQIHPEHTVPEGQTAPG